MKKIPRDINASRLIKLLNQKYKYEITRQAGSHIRITTTLNGEHHVTIPNHNPIRLGTLSSIIHDIAFHFGKTKEQIVRSFFKKLSISRNVPHDNYRGKLNSHSNTFSFTFLCGSIHKNFSRQLKIFTQPFCSI